MRKSVDVSREFQHGYDEHIHIRGTRRDFNNAGPNA